MSETPSESPRGSRARRISMRSRGAPPIELERPSVARRGRVTGLIRANITISPPVARSGLPPLIACTTCSANLMAPGAVTAQLGRRDMSGQTAFVRAAFSGETYESLQVAYADRLPEPNEQLETAWCDACDTRLVGPHAPVRNANGVRLDRVEMRQGSAGQVPTCRQCDLDLSRADSLRPVIMHPGVIDRTGGIVRDWPGGLQVVVANMANETMTPLGVGEYLTAQCARCSVVVAEGDRSVRDPNEPRNNHDVFTGAVLVSALGVTPTTVNCTHCDAELHSAAAVAIEVPAHAVPLHVHMHVDGEGHPFVADGADHAPVVFRTARCRGCNQVLALHSPAPITGWLPELPEPPQQRAPGFVAGAVLMGGGHRAQAGYHCSGCDADLRQPRALQLQGDAVPSINRAGHLHHDDASRPYVAGGPDHTRIPYEAAYCAGCNQLIAGAPSPTQPPVLRPATVRLVNAQTEQPHLECCSCSAVLTAIGNIVIPRDPDEAVHAHLNLAGEVVEYTDVGSYAEGPVLNGYEEAHCDSCGAVVARNNAPARIETNETPETYWSPASWTRDVSMRVQTGRMSSRTPNATSVSRRPRVPSYQPRSGAARWEGGEPVRCVSCDRDLTDASAAHLRVAAEGVRNRAAFTNREGQIFVFHGGGGGQPQRRMLLAIDSAVCVCGNAIFEQRPAESRRLAELQARMDEVRAESADLRARLRTTQGTGVTPVPAEAPAEGFASLRYFRATCPACAADLTQADSVEAHVNVPGTRGLALQRGALISDSIAGNYGFAGRLNGAHHDTACTNCTASLALLDVRCTVVRVGPEEVEAADVEAVEAEADAIEVALEAAPDAPPSVGGIVRFPDVVPTQRMLNPQATGLHHRVLTDVQMVQSHCGSVRCQAPLQTTRIGAITMFLRDRAGDQYGAYCGPGGLIVVVGREHARSGVEDVGRIDCILCGTPQMVRTVHGAVAPAEMLPIEQVIRFTLSTAGDTRIACRSCGHWLDQTRGVQVRAADWHAWGDLAGTGPNDLEVRTIIAGDGQFRSVCCGQCGLRLLGPEDVRLRTP